MFGRRKVPFEGSSQGQGSIPPPGSVEPFPIGKMNDALEAAIMLFTKVLGDAGVDAGGLAIHGNPGPDVSDRLANCTTYRSKPDEITYLALGITPDFKQFMYPPHCRLFFILNATGICEHPAAAEMLRDIASGQLPSPLVDAHLMRRWIRYILPTGKMMGAGAAAQEEMLKQMFGELMEVVNATPPSFAERLDLKASFHEWADGFPGAIGYPLDDGVQRMNGLPVTPFIGDVLTRELARLQAEGLRQR